MSFLKNLFAKKEEPIQTYAEFWEWFQKNEKTFHDLVKKNRNVEKDFIDVLLAKLAEVKEGFYCLTGMCDENTVELILSAEGEIKNIVFVEEIIQAAPNISGWKFTALKPSLDISDCTIHMGGYIFNDENLSFYANDNVGFPDEIDLTLVYEGYKEKDKDLISNGCFIFLDNFLGELNFATSIDNVAVIGKEAAKMELVPIEKLKDFLIWREKEFIEKYEGTRRDTANDGHSMLEGELKNGKPLLAVINTELLRWDAKASHPWIAVLNLNFKGRKDNGMPTEDELILLNKMEDELLAELLDKDGYLYIGRQTTSGERKIFFACKEFRKPALIFHKTQKNDAYPFEMEYEIYKDKYWQSFDQFIPKT